jgi:4-azaleucine resistance transporter AzlC
MVEHEMIQDKQRKSVWLRGVLAAVPIVLGYIPVGFAFGVLAEKAGLSLFNTIMMSLVVYAGSAQLIAVGLFASGLTPLSIILTTFIVNLRHLLFSAAIFPHVAQWRKRELAGFAFELTDESFALHATRFDLYAVDKGEVFAINLTAHAAWLLGSGLGAAAGRMVSEIEPFGLDYVLPAMFIALLVMQIKQQSHIWATLMAGIVSVVLLLLGFSQWHVIFATVIGATLGVWMEVWKNRSS